MTQNKKKHHYIPRFYLHGFAEITDPALLYVYQKGQRECFQTTPERIGYENNYYTIENDDGSRDTNTVEDYLHDQVESPAHAVLTKIRNQHIITTDDKWIFCRYVAYLMKRVPRARQRLKTIIAERVVESEKEAYDSEIDAAIAENPKRREFYESRRREIHQVLGRYKEEVPSTILLNVLRYPSPRVTEALSKMTWRFLVCPKGYFYLTSDNPVFYDEGTGISKPYSEVTVPVSHQIALWLSWRTDLVEGYNMTTSQAVRQINRRTVGNATRYIFSPRHSEWIVTLANKRHHKLTRLI